MPDSYYRDNLAGLELLAVKSRIANKIHTDADVELLRVSLGEENDVSLIAAGYVLGENFIPLKPLAVKVLETKLLEMATAKVGPRTWAQSAILEGLSLTDDAILLLQKDAIIIFLKILVSSNARLVGFGNARFLLQRLAGLDLEEAKAMIKAAEGQ